MRHFIRLTAAAAIAWLLLPMGSTFAQSVQVKTLSADYTNQKVTFSISWEAGTRDNRHLPKVWVFVDFAAVVTANTLDDWQRAEITAPTATAGTISGLTEQGFFLEGTPGAFSATVIATMENAPPKFSWCAYATDYPPVATMKGNTFELSGTPPFTVNGTYTESSFTYTGGSITSLTDLTGCEGIVITAPVVATTSPAAVCAGTVVTLTATASGGTTTAMTYTWNIGGAQTTTTANSYTIPAVSVTSGRTYSVTATNEYGNTSDAASGTITVYAKPTLTSIAASPATICRGGTSTLTINATGAAEYSFDNGDTWQEENTKAVSPAATAAYTAKVRSVDGCETDSKTATVAVIADPTIKVSAAQTICYGAAGSALTATVSGGNGSNTFAWQYSANGNAPWNSASGSASTLATGNLTASRYYRVRVTQSTSGCTSTWSTPVLKAVRPQFDAGAINTTGQTLCAGSSFNTISSSSAASGGDGSITYQWLRNGTAIGNSNNANYTPPQAGTYTRQAHDGTCHTGWENSSGSWVVTVNVTPAAPTVTGGGNQCGGTRSITATPGSGGTGIRWEDDDSTVGTRTVSTTGVYYAVSTTDAGCESSNYGSAVVTISTIPDAPTVSGAGTACGSKTITAATGSGGSSIRWTDNNSTTTPRTVSTSGTYTAVSVSADGCVSSAASVEVTINTVPEPPAVTGGGSQCGGTRSITAIAGTNGNGIRWTDDNSTASPRTVNATGNYAVVSTTSAGCSSTAKTISVIIDTAPTAPTGLIANPSTMCSGVTRDVTLTASGGNSGSGAYFQFGTGTTVGNNAAGTTTATAYTIYNTPATNFWVRRVGNTTCAGNTGGVTVSVTVNPTPAAPTMGGGGTQCGGSRTITAIAGTNGNGIRWLDNGSTAISRTVNTTGTYRAVSVSAAGCESSSASVEVTINTPPTITSFTASPATICVGGSSTLTIAATGAASYSFDNGSNWQTSNTYQTPPANATGDYTYTAKVRFSADCESDSQTATVTVIPDPVVTLIANETICYDAAGSDLIATVSGGSGSNTFEWEYQINPASYYWNRLPETSGTLATGNLTVTRYYHVRVVQSTSGCSSMGYSSSVRKTVLPQFTAGAIHTTGQVLCGGGTFNTITGTTAASGGDGNITYQWLRNGTVISGSNSANYTPTQAGIYTRQAKDGTCNTGWTTATGSWEVIESAIPAAPTMGGGGTQCGGNMTITATPSGGNSIRWDDGSTETTRTVSTTGTYRAVSVSAAGCESSSAGVTVTINPVPAAPRMSGGGLACGSTTISATAGSNGSGIEWQDDYSTESPRTITTTGTYYAVSTTAAGCESSPASVEVTIDNTVPVISSVTATTICEGGSGTIAITATGANSYRLDGGSWQSSRNFTVAPTATKTYTVEARSAAGCVSDSKTVVVTVVPIPVVTVSATETICYGTAGSDLVAIVNGGGNNTFEWQYSANGNAPWSNASGNAGTLATGNLTASRHYRARATQSTSGCTSNWSNSVLKTVRPQFKAGAISTTGQTLCDGSTFNTITGTTAASGGNGSITYQWLRNGTAISNSNSANYTPTQAGIYTRQVHDGLCHTGWATATGSWEVTVETPPTFTVAANPPTISPGGSSNIEVTATGADSYRLDNGEWQLGNIFAVTPTATTDYTVKARSAFGCEADSKTVTVTVEDPRPVITSFDVNPSTVCEGSPATLTVTATGATEYRFYDDYDGMSGSIRSISEWQNSDTLLITVTFHPNGLTPRYFAKVRSADGIESMLTGSVIPIIHEKPPVNMVLLAIPPILCDSGSDSIVMLTMDRTDGSSPHDSAFHYSYNGKPWRFNPRDYGLPAGTHTVKARSVAEGCIYDFSIVVPTVSKDDRLTITATAQPGLCDAPIGAPREVTLTVDDGNDYSDAFENYQYDLNTFTFVYGEVDDPSGNYSARISDTTFTIRNTTATDFYVVREFHCPMQGGVNARIADTITLSGCGWVEGTGAPKDEFCAFCEDHQSMPYFTTHFVSDQTWTVGNQIWSDNLAADWCNKTDYYGGDPNTNVYRSDCRNSTLPEYGHLFSWCMAYKYRETICPQGWHLPTGKEFVELNAALGGDNPFTGTPQAISMEELVNNYLNTWGARLAGIDYSQFHGQGAIAWYWGLPSLEMGMAPGMTLSIFSDPATIGNVTFDLGGMRNPDGAFSLRCVKDEEWPICDGITQVVDMPSNALWNNADWYCQSINMRLPSVSELQCMCEIKESLPGDYSSSYPHWSGSYDGSSGSYYTVDFNNNCSVGTQARNYEYPAKCVKDASTGYGIVYWSGGSGGTFDEITNIMYDGHDTWDYANTYCQNLGMRLPTVNELAGICTNKDQKPGGYINDYYWSSTPTGNGTGNYEMIYFTTPCMTGNAPNSYNTFHFFQCVR